YEVVVTGPNKEGIEKIKELGAKFIEVPVNKNGLNPIADLAYCLKLYRLIKNEQADAIMGYTIKPVIYGSIAGWLAGVKNRTAMVTGAGYLFASSSIKARILKNISFILYKIGLGVAHKVIFQNIDDLNEFVDNSLVEKGKCHVVNGSGVNMKRFLPSAYPESPSFFFLGRLVKSKGGMDFVKAAKIVKEIHPTTRFMMLGKLENDLPDAITTEELMPYVNDGTVELFPETDNITQYYSMSSVFVLPTAYREGTPRVILEALASARAVITTFTPGCKETVVDGKNGFFIPVHNPVAIAEKMTYFIEHPKEIIKMGSESLKICQKKYDISIINNNMLAIMDL
ncbi:MAG: glycosyltransferase family 4 protein, partial [Muribaculaceae bacterium]|nr:glycosyltransferase family 4 protein [Muribaculaceae bacterium]